jgi:mannitol 2-dehydrogenase
LDELMAFKLNKDTLNSLPDGVSVPSYDRSGLSAGIIHIGVGNFHRAHQAYYLDRLFETGADHDWAIIGAGIKPFDAAMRDKLKAQDWLNTVVELDPNGLTARVTGAMIDFLEIGPAPLIEALADPAIRIVSLTITEGGYFVDPMTGGFDTKHPDILHDAAHPDAPKTVFGILLAGLQKRRAAGVAPFTVMSCDNLPENGHVAGQAVRGLAQMMSDDLGAWVAKNVAFPNGMVDCITPATTDLERQKVTDLFGIEDAAPVVCEPFHQWVLEDNFPTGRPALERVGVEFVTDVTPYELMKLRILNGGHAAIAYPAGLLGIHFVHDAMADKDISDWLMALQHREVIPTLSPIEGVDFVTYLNTTAARFSNAAVGDTIPRLCLDGSNRQPKFILATLRAALEAGGPIDGLALELALWCRYCAGTTEAGEPIKVDDAMAAPLAKAALAARTDPPVFLRLEAVFGDLGTNPRLTEAFTRQLNSLGANGVRRTLRAFIDG